MSRFDVIEFLQDYRVHYRDSGPNCAKGNVVVKCPWCGDSDPSEHLGIDLSTGAWGCWRNPNHRGTRPHKLVMQLAKCSFDRACEIVGDHSVVNRENFGATVQSLLSPRYSGRVQKTPEFWPSEFTPLKSNRQSASRFLDYLWDRGFDDPLELARSYALYYAYQGRYAGRIVLPVFQGEEVVTWSARSIYPDAERRYMAAPRDSGAMSSKEVVYEPPDCDGGDLLFVTEGPFDMLNMDFFGRELGARTTCLFGTAVTKRQMLLLNELASKFTRCVVLMDDGAQHVGMEIARGVVSTDVVIGRLPDRASDPGELYGDEIETLVSTYSPSTMRSSPVQSHA